MIDSWLKAINDGKFVGCLMVDFRKAFDLVDHNILLQKLKLYKCDESSLSWFNSYLSNRTQRVSMNNKCSDSEQISFGHHENMSVQCTPPYTPLLYSKTGVYRGKHNFLIFALKHRSWVLVRTASMRRFKRVSTIYVLSKNKKIINFFI